MNNVDLIGITIYIALFIISIYGIRELIKLTHWIDEYLKTLRKEHK